MTAACRLIPCYRGGIVDFTYLGDASLYHIYLVVMPDADD